MTTTNRSGDRSGKRRRTGASTAGGDGSGPRAIGRSGGGDQRKGDGADRGEDHEESRKERSERRWNEMLQELRVAQTGVQILTGFLLTLPFSDRFGDLTWSAKVAYLMTVCSSILAAGLIIAPVSYHRVLFGKQEKEWLIEAGNYSARAGLALLGLTMCGVIFLVFDLIVSRTAAYVGSSAAFVTLVALWLVVPVVGGHVDKDTAA